MGVASAVLSLALSVVPTFGGVANFQPVVISTQPDPQVDPHVDGDLAVYADQSIVGGNFVQRIHYYRYSTGVDSVVPNTTGGDDSVADIGQGRIVFTRTDSTSRVMLFDTNTGVLTELAPTPGANRNSPRIGGSRVAFVDYGVDPAGEIMVFDLTTSSLTRLTYNSTGDQNPEISSDGNVVSWQSFGLNMDIYRARFTVTRTGAFWDVRQLTTSAFNEENASTDGIQVAFQRENASGPTGTDIVITSMYGAETVLEIPGHQFHPSLLGQFVLFESREPGSSVSDLFLYDSVTNTYRQLSVTPFHRESLNGITKIATTCSGPETGSHYDPGSGTCFLLRIAWQTQLDSDPSTANVYGATF